jgi:hypothetical protein
MTAQPDAKPALQVQPPYAKDALGRKPYAQNLTRLIERIPKGVIAIDGDWGVGKSWFGEQLKADLDQQGKVRTVWVDVFEADWSDDPSMSLISSIASQLEDAEADSFLQKAVPYLSKILPAVTKAAIKAAGNYVGVDKDVIEAAADAGKSSSEIYLKKHLLDAREKKKNLDDLKKLLTDAIGEQHSKMVVFVDELDRCSPSYAIRFLERLKHLFDLDGVVYVLLWNRVQVQKAVETFYGAGSNGQMYLDKFVDYPLHLPMSQTRNDELPLTTLVNSIVGELEGGEQISLYDNAHLIVLVASLLNLTARETKRISAWWLMSNNRQYPVLETWLLGLKVKQPNIFSGLRSGILSAHQQAADLLSSTLMDQKIDKDYINDLIQFHNRFATGNFGDLDQNFIRKFASPGGDFKNSVSAAMRRLESDFS